jgi:mRNA-degrading endonuclease RelE of RelBE toxin-antitoxin system
MSDPLAIPTVEPITFSPPIFIKMEVVELWPEFQAEQRNKQKDQGVHYSEPLEPHERERIRVRMIETRDPTSWLMGMTKDFRKAVREIDRKLQGRILEAINDISENPVQTNGDTVWRYRIGDYRLVYLPDREKHQITLWAFAARGGVYD